MGFSAWLTAQDQINVSGSLESNVNIYLRDPKIGAANTPQYERQLVGTDTWLTLRAQVSGFDLGLRYDLFANSQLLNPNDSYTDQGLGRWYAGKQVGKLHIMGGYIYDQFGSGTIFRAYEERPLLIDNALVGLRLTYDLSENWTIKGLAGRQKFLFELYPSVMKGLNIEGFKSFGDEKVITIAPGAGIVHKTLSDQQMDALAGSLGQYTPVDFIAEAHTIAGPSPFTILSAGRFAWYVEGSYKTEDVINDIYATRTLWTAKLSRASLYWMKVCLLYHLVVCRWRPGTFRSIQAHP